MGTIAPLIRELPRILSCFGRKLTAARWKKKRYVEVFMKRQPLSAYSPTPSVHSVIPSGTALLNLIFLDGPIGPFFVSESWNEANPRWIDDNIFRTY